MIYYKWIASEKPTLHGVPGFVWTSLEDAMEMKEEVDNWISGNLNLYSINGPEPVKINTLFRSSLSSKHQSKPLSNSEATQAKKYIESKPEDFFGLSMATENDEELFRRLAATHGALLSMVPGIKNIKEAYVGVEVFMKKLPEKFTVTEDVEIVLEGQRFMLEQGDIIIINED